MCIYQHVYYRFESTTALKKLTVIYIHILSFSSAIINYRWANAAHYHHWHLQNATEMWNHRLFTCMCYCIIAPLPMTFTWYTHRERLNSGSIARECKLLVWLWFSMLFSHFVVFIVFMLIIFKWNDELLCPSMNTIRTRQANLKCCTHVH